MHFDPEKDHVWKAVEAGLRLSQQGMTIWSDEESRLHLPPQAVLEEVERYAAGLKRLGVEPGDRVAVLAQTTPEVMLSFLACWRAGGIAVPLPLPMRAVDPRFFMEQTAAKLRACGARLAVVPAALLGFVDDLDAGCPIVGAEELPCGGACPERSPSPEDVALIQFTSGSTSQPRGVTLTHSNLLANAFSIISRIGVTPDDRVVSWLPLYHDMGLIGFFLTALVSGASTSYLSPQLFVSRPELWLRALSESGGTITGGPNFSYALVGRLISSGAARGMDLSRLRLALNGAEPVDLQVMEGLVEAAAPLGLRPEAPYPVYGLAECTLAVTFPDPGRPFKVDWVSRYHLEKGEGALPVERGSAGARPLVCLGSPLPGLEVRIRGKDGRWLGERELGEVCVRGASVMRGYWNDPERTAEALADGWLRTGDLGYMHAGELYLAGRIKDMVIIGGRNIYPEDVERCGEGVPGVRKGNVVAFAVTNRRGKERMVLVGETHLEPGAEAAQAARRLSRRVAEEIGAPLGEAVLVRAGSLPKTSSGKKQRFLTRQLYREDGLEVVARSRAVSEPVG
jgi:fatty-acyl-CoA synthase